MKKILAVVLALTMIMGMSIPAFAANITESGSKATVGDTATIVVNGKFTDKGEDVYGTTYSVVVEWDDMTFTYSSDKKVYRWDADELDYVEVEGESEAAGWDKEEAKITVTNRSNAPVYITAEITGDVFDVTESAECASAEGKTVDTLPKAYLYVRPVGTIATDVQATVTLTISDTQPTP